MGRIAQIVIAALSLSGALGLGYVLVTETSDQVVGTFYEDEVKSQDFYPDPLHVPQPDTRTPPPK